MSLNDPIADLLSRMRNAIRAGHSAVLVPASRIKREICDVLKNEGYIDDYTISDAGPHSTIRVTLKYLPNREPVMKALRRVSKPSLRVYVRGRDIKPVRSGLGISILSTSRGIMTGKQARAARVGGELLCEIW